jgi:PAS domain S-box-containing protein
MVQNAVRETAVQKAAAHKQKCRSQKDLEELLRQCQRYEKALGSISKLLLSKLPSRLIVDKTLGHLLEATDHSRAYLLENQHDSGGHAKELKLYTEVVAGGVVCRFDEPLTGKMPDNSISISGYGWLSRNRIQKGNVSDVGGSKPLMGVDYDVLAFITVPIQVDDHWWGSLFLEDIRREHRYGETVDRLLGTAADMLGAFFSRKSAEKVLKEREKKLHMVAENTLDGIWMMDMDLRFTYVNSSVEHMLGYTPGEWIGSTLQDHCSKEELDRMAGIIFEALQAGEHPGVLFETKLKHKNGDFIPVEILGKVLYDDEKRVIGLQGTTRDIRERKEAERQRLQLETQLRQLHKMEALGTLAGGVAHDFNNILSAVIGYAELARLGVPEGSQLASHLDAIMNAGMRATDLVKQILTFSRRSEKKRDFICIAPLIKEALKLLRSSLPTTIEIRSKIPSRLANTLADPTQIHQIVMNLCTNAAHAMDETGGMLTVKLEEVMLDSNFTKRFQELSPGLHLKLTVQDTGQGMTREIMESIFDPYFTTKAVGAGTGMGLSVVHGIVKSYGGEIGVSSSLGKGSVFEVYLPAASGQAKVESARRTSLPLGNEHILFVDDEPELAMIGKDRLERLGYRVEAKTSSLEALEVFRSDPHRFNLVVTDMTMPGLTGTKLAEEILRLRADIPIILCTGYSSQISEQKALELGIRAFHMKPLIFADLAESVRRILDAEKPST